MLNHSNLMKCFVCFLGILLIGFFSISKSDARLPDGPGVLKLVFGSEVLIYENVGGILNSIPYYLEFFCCKW